MDPKISISFNFNFKLAPSRNYQTFKLSGAGNLLCMEQQKAVM